MRLDDGTADAQAHAHAVRFGGVERLEESLAVLGFEAVAQILHRDAHRGMADQLTC